MAKHSKTNAIEQIMKERYPGAEIYLNVSKVNSDYVFLVINNEEFVVDQHNLDPVVYCNEVSLEYEAIRRKKDFEERQEKVDALATAVLETDPTKRLELVLDHAEGFLIRHGGNYQRVLYEDLNTSAANEENYKDLVEKIKEQGGKKKEPKRAKTHS